MMFDTLLKKRLAFGLAVALMAVFWLVILPAYARQKGMRKHLEWLEEQRIDPSAMYYTELEVMEDILRQQRTQQLADHAAYDK
ncbi:hypothetical protein ACYFX5_08775 [Bremerella sp. T1]|uniref:hypothetical protein n=1 Tax=Bremerella sp. TYQ1 TaxID=3119568 RepID=UPI001CCEA054|nr:hypothetical protein [Bremerella volcania]UBM38348.1 hypothetical protein LA756_10700 [Bremerella volcania]